MTAVKWIVVAIFSLAALGALGMGFTSGSVARPAELDTQPALALRAFPAGSVSAGAAPAAAAKPDAAKPAEVADAKPAEVADAKPAEPKPAEAKPAEAKPAEVAKAPPAETKPPPAENKPPPVAENKPPPVAENKPPPAAAGTPPPAAAAKPPAPAAAEGLLNLRASDTADVYLDGKKLGGSPLLGVKARAGNHKVRFDCYDAAGNTVAGPVQVVSVKADGEVDVEFTCPAE